MTIAPIRDLGAVGVMTDTDPYDNQVQAFTFAQNARFEDKRISRGPLFATTGTLALNASPRYALSYGQLSGTLQYHIANRDGTVTQWAAAGLGGASTESTISPVAWTPSNDDEPYTSCVFQNVVYLNRPDRIPWYKPKNSTLFAPMPNVSSKGWDSTWRAGAMREVGGVIVAMNITKGSDAFPTMVKTSDFPVFDNPPAIWAPDTTNSATEIVIADLGEALIDGWPLRASLILYTQNECWTMDPRSDSLMFNYVRLFQAETSSGVINQNCIANYNNSHYVFGDIDIWTHNGFQRMSLASGKVRDFIYNNMDKTQSNLFFVQHNARITEIMFCYVSNDPYCSFPNAQGSGCNRAAVWNYRSNCWYFYDLPYVVSGALGTSFTGSVWSGMGATTWDSMAGSWGSLGDATKLSLLTVGTAQTGAYGSLACAVRSFDRVDQSAGNGILDTAATAPVLIENQGIDLDALQENLRDYKIVRSIYPEGRFSPNSGALQFSFSMKDFAGTDQSAYGPPQSYDGNGLYKLDFNQAGRFVDMKITFDGFTNFSLSGFDFDVIKTGSR